MTPEGLKLLDEATQDWCNHLTPTLAAIIANKDENVASKETAAGMIYASLIGVSQQGEYLVRLKDADAPSEVAILKKVLALTDREEEVLVWLAKGKSNRDIAVILDCSPRTVNKHLEQIYNKLLVENRIAAAMRAIQVLSQSPP